MVVLWTVQLIGMRVQFAQNVTKSSDTTPGVLRRRPKIGKGCLKGSRDSQKRVRRLGFVPSAERSFEKMSSAISKGYRGLGTRGPTGRFVHRDESHQGSRSVLDSCPIAIYDFLTPCQSALLSGKRT